jgi:hypothetical protein
MNISILKNMTLFIMLSFFSINGSQTAESTNHDAASTGSRLSTIKNFVRERVSGLYYNTSVAGYGSNSYPVCEFLKQKCSDGWTLKEVTYNKDVLPSPGEEGYDIYEQRRKETSKGYLSTLDINEQKSEIDLK